LIDDLVTQEHTEPYRQMTSRAEYRLLLRQDNADLRLTPLSYNIGLVDYDRYQVVQRKQAQITSELTRLEETTISPKNGTPEILAQFGLPELDDGVNAKKFLRRPEVTYTVIQALTPPIETLTTDVIEQVTIETKFEGYLAKQQSQVERMKRLETLPIPLDFDYESLHGVRAEARLKLARFRPATVGQANRIAGVNPADISILLIHLEKRQGNKATE
jgi:tRNA uridine 5-carboxymethylaminomethyl modification enzyme